MHAANVYLLQHFTASYIRFVNCALVKYTLWYLVLEMDALSNDATRSWRQFIIVYPQLFFIVVLFVSVLFCCKILTVRLGIIKRQYRRFWV